MFLGFMNRSATKEPTMAQASEPVWSAELKLTVRGPKEGPVIVTVNYEATTRGMCEQLQNDLASLAQKYNGA